MSSPIKNTGKRPYHEQALSPVSSPSKSSPSKRPRGSLSSAINGLPVQPQSSSDQSPSQASPSRVFAQNMQHQHARARMDLRAVFREEPAPAQTQPTAAASSSIIPEVQEPLVQSDVFRATEQTPVYEPTPAPAPMAAASSSTSNSCSNQRQISRNLNICHQIALRSICVANLRCDSTAWKKDANLHLLMQDFTSSARCNLIAAIDARQSPSEKKALLEATLLQLIQVGDWILALEICHDIDRLFPTIFSVVPWARAYCALKQKKYEECFELLIKASAIREAFSKDPNATITEKDLELQDELILKIRVALEIAKADVQGNTEVALCVLSWLSELAQLMHDHSESLVALRAVEELRPGMTMLLQGCCYWSLEMPEEAIECFITANANRDACEGSSFDRLIKIAFALKHYGATNGNEVGLNTAVSYCEWAIEESTTHEEGILALRMQYDCCVLLEEYDTALEVMQELEALEPEDSSPLLFQGMCLFKLDRPAEGLQAYRRAYESRHNNRIVDENILDTCIKDIIFVADFDLSKKFNEWSIELLLNRAS